MEIKVIEFEAEIRQVKTMVDHTYNVTINLPEYCADQAAELMRRVGAIVKCAAVETDNQLEKD